MKKTSPKLWSRRDFVASASAAAGTFAACAVGAPHMMAQAARPEFPGMPSVILGRTGARVSRLGVGCAQFQRRDIDAHHTSKVLHRAVELGVNYLDVAPNYGNENTGFSEEKMGPAIKEIRDKVFLVTKTEEPSYEGTWRLLRQSMKRLRTDYLDLVHLHNFGYTQRFPDPNFVLGKKGALGALLEAKRQGAIRFIGATGHLYPSRFHALLDTEEIDVLMNAVNFIVRHTYDFEHKVWSRAAHQNLGLVGMKILGGSGPGLKGHRIPAGFYEKAIRYALGIPGMACAVIGMETIPILEQAVSTVASYVPHTADESEALALEGMKLAATGEWRAAYGNPIR